MSVASMTPHLILSTPAHADIQLTCKQCNVKLVIDSPVAWDHFRQLTKSFSEEHQHSVSPQEETAVQG